MPAITLTVGPASTSTTVTAGELTRILAAITADRNLPMTNQQALAFSLQILLDDIGRRVLAFEARQIVEIPIDFGAGKASGAVMPLAASLLAGVATHT
jgi:hypothetical protein